MIKVREDIAALQNATGTGEGSLGARVTALETTINTASTGLTAKVAALETAVGALQTLISKSGDNMSLFGLDVAIADTTGIVSLSEPATTGEG